MARYNGWANRETWNVALWIGNDEGLYTIARECQSYEEFRSAMRDHNLLETPDHVAYNDSALDEKELDACIRELRTDG